jgi:hypothetical protein
MKERISSRWNFVRILWLLMGIGISLQAVTERNFLMLVPALYFVFASVANVGCFAGNCATGYAPPSAREKETTADVEYEEISSSK